MSLSKEPMFACIGGKKLSGAARRVQFFVAVWVCPGTCLRHLLLFVVIEIYDAVQDGDICAPDAGQALFFKFLLGLRAIIVHTFQETIIIDL